ncbi:hypothetical protein GIB67_000847 [Kingdonia uniflora]|uniref:DYW domain-containing protein n=1 Tax=Kingdonia uniflora TaxID=39325 RepID=A0A7J7NRI9_9MAGN|nr:hypothetical protein GIB67_000847 [Kingdonia uniflora]
MLVRRDTVAWNMMILANSMHGNGEEGDNSNEQSDEIYSYLEELGEKMRVAGFRPNTDHVLQDVDQEEKVEVLCSHSEKLAVAFGILNLNGGSTIRVFKNLRVCGDCDTALTGTASTVPGVQRNKGPCGVHGRVVDVYQPSSRARRASGIQPADARATSG